MFIDGVTYAVVSRNLAAGDGSFWSPFYTSTVYPQFHEQPPLGFAMEAVAFAIFGDHPAVERGYSLLMGILTALLLVAIWRRTIRHAPLEWLPIVFWVVPSTVTWSIVNNMLENTQAVLTTASVYAIVRSVQAAHLAVPWAAMGGGLIVAAVLVKGPTGFFPLAAPLLIAMAFPSLARTALVGAAPTFATVGAACAGILAFDAPRAALTAYWNQHVYAAISGDRGGSRVAGAIALARHLAGGIFLRLGGMLALLFVLTSLAGFTREKQAADRWRWASVFLLLALAGSLPVILSTKIAGHYLVPSIPFYALGCATLSLPLVEPLYRRYSDRRWATTGMSAAGAILLLLVTVVPFLPVRIEPRDVPWIAEYEQVGGHLTPRTTISSCPAVADDWGLHAYMQRFFRVSVDTERRHSYYLQLTDRGCDAPADCSVLTSTARMVLLDCRP
jgi:Dolichyl-phosphate-mannose-protein mannosyltransferase